ncbi:MAG: hypothetical protein A3H35_15925 [Betaproteobacteria bacterium RIFCSPLOWO2_02_FULL_62_17]|nr:MAG: hypothetical protein A3H35_15925 [Betaproteobacteria bacterium RIFCSPLOWO2_02_FULL_62_17]
MRLKRANCHPIAAATQLSAFVLLTKVMGDSTKLYATGTVSGGFITGRGLRIKWVYFRLIILYDVYR